MKVKVRQHVSQGMGGGYWVARVVTMDAGATLPPNAVQVDDATPESDWARDENQDASEGQEG